MSLADNLEVQFWAYSEEEFNDWKNEFSSIPEKTPNKDKKIDLGWFKARDVQNLLDLVAAKDQALANELRPSETLTIYATLYQYPEEVEVPASLSRSIADNI